MAEFRTIKIVTSVMCSLTKLVIVRYGTCFMFIEQVPRLTKNEVLLVNIGSLSTGGRVLATKADLAKISLTNPVCTEIGEKIALSRKVENHWR